MSSQDYAPKKEISSFYPPQRHLMGPAPSEIHPRRLPQMNAVSVLPGVDEREVRRRLLLDYNLEIGAGLGDLAGKIWRFGILGHSCKMENVMLSLCALETVFADLGIKIEFGAAEAAAYHAYAAIPNKVQSLRAVAA